MNLQFLMLVLAVPPFCWQKSQMQQDMRAINTTVIPHHPVLPHPHTLLSGIPADTCHFAVRDLCSVFFRILA